MNIDYGKYILLDLMIVKRVVKVPETCLISPARKNDYQGSGGFAFGHIKQDSESPGYLIGTCLSPLLPSLTFFNNKQSTKCSVKRTSSNFLTSFIFNCLFSHYLSFFICLEFPSPLPLIIVIGSRQIKS